MSLPLILPPFEAPDPVSKLGFVVIVALVMLSFVLGVSLASLRLGASQLRVRLRAFLAGLFAALWLGLTPQVPLGLLGVTRVAFLAFALPLISCPCPHGRWGEDAGARALSHEKCRRGETLAREGKDPSPTQRKHLFAFRSGGVYPRLPGAYSPLRLGVGHEFLNYQTEPLVCGSATLRAPTFPHRTRRIGKTR